MIGTLATPFVRWVRNLRRAWDRYRLSSQRADYYDYLASVLTGMGGARTLKEVFLQDAMRYGRKSLRGRLSAEWLATYQRAGGDLYATWSHHLPRGELVLIRAAQSMGNAALLRTLHELSMVLRLLGDAVRMLGATLWPAALALLVAMLMSLAVRWFTLPRLMDAFAAVPPEYYGVLTRRLVSFGAFVEEYYLVFLILLVGSVALVDWSLPNFTGSLRRRLDRWLWWKVYRCVAALQFLSFLVIALGDDAHSSTQLRNALLRQRTGAAPWLARHIDLMLARIDSGIVGPSTLDTGLLSPEQFWFLSDMVLARGLSEGLILTRDRLRAHILSTVARQAAVLRWGVLLVCLAFVLGLALWHYAVIDELRRALTFYFASQ